MIDNARQIHRELLTQHEELRAVVAHCDQLADELELGRIEPLVLLGEVARLRVAFETHNRFEERLLRPLSPSETAVLAHIDEHRAVQRSLGANPVTAELRATLARIRDHLDAEERYFATALGGPELA